MLDDPLSFGSSAGRVELAPAGAAVVTGVKRDTGVFYSEIQTDTDLFVKPVLGGVESFHVLRSAQSPETVSVQLGLADRTTSHLIEDPNSGGALLMVDGGSVVRISTPTAADADGRPVPVTLSLDGSTLSMHVDHRGAELAYPIIIDPVSSTPTAAAGPGSATSTAARSTSGRPTTTTSTATATAPAGPTPRPTPTASSTAGSPPTRPTSAWAS
jgi:hypothetical protein